MPNACRVDAVLHYACLVNSPAYYLCTLSNQCLGFGTVAQQQHSPPHNSGPASSQSKPLQVDTEDLFLLTIYAVSKSALPDYAADELAFPLYQSRFPALEDSLLSACGG